MRKNIGQTQIQRDIIIGSLQGDAYCQRGRWLNSNCRIQFSQNEPYKDYLYFIYSFFSEFCTIPHIIKPNLKSSSRKGFENTSSTYKFYTPTHLVFNEFRTMFYNDSGQKFVPQNIGEQQSPISQAFWIQDDGSKHYKGLKIATNSFTKEEVMQLIKVQDKNFNQDCTIHNSKKGDKIYYIIYIRTHSMDNLRKQVIPYFHESMLYKLGIDKKG